MQNLDIYFLLGFSRSATRITLLHGPISVYSCTVNYEKNLVSSISALVHSDETFIFVYHNYAAHSFAREKREN